MSLNNAITLRILQLCKESGLTINGLSYRCGITQSTIVNITGGRNKSATISTIQKICDGLEIDLPTFFHSELFDNVELDPE